MKSRTIQGKAWSSLTTILQVSDKKRYKKEEILGLMGRILKNVTDETFVDHLEKAVNEDKKSS